MSQKDKTSLSNAVTGNEIQVHHYKLESYFPSLITINLSQTKNRRMASPFVPMKKLIQSSTFSWKFGVIVFWDVDGVILVDFMPIG